jgi:hypothetical protein
MEQLMTHKAFPQWIEILENEIPQKHGKLQSFAERAFAKFKAGLEQFKLKQQPVNESTDINKSDDTSKLEGIERYLLTNLEGLGLNSAGGSAVDRLVARALRTHLEDAVLGKEISDPSGKKEWVGFDIAKFKEVVNQVVSKLLKEADPDELKTEIARVLAKVDAALVKAGFDDFKDAFSRFESQLSHSHEKKHDRKNNPKGPRTLVLVLDGGEGKGIKGGRQYFTRIATQFLAPGGESGENAPLSDAETGGRMSEDLVHRVNSEAPKCGKLSKN